MKERNPIQDAVRYALAAGLAASFASIPSMAFAQDDEDVAEQALIEVTGSRIKRVDVEGPSPVAVITRADIENSGDISVADVLRQSSYNQFGSFRQRSGSSAQSQATISLRGLGAARTLVLLDGRRMAGSPSFGSGSAGNLNTIPIAAVERIEILRDGASAIYGADAVGGVVNIILRKDYEGLQISAEIGRPTQAGGDENAYSIVGGITSGKGNITFSLDHADSEIIFNGDRDFSNVGLSPFGFPGSFALSTPGGVFLGTFPDPRCPNNLNTDPNFPNSRINTGTGECNYNYAATSANEASLTRDTMFVNGNYQVSEDLNFFARGTFSRTESFGRYAPAPQAGGSPFLPSMSAGNPNNPTAPGAVPTAGLASNFPLPFAGATDLSQFDTNGDGVPDVTGPFDLSVFYRNVPGGFRDSNVTTILYDYLIGFEGSSDMFGGLDWDAGFQYSRQTNDDTSSGLAFRDGLQSVIDDGSFDIFGVNGPTDPDIAAGFSHQGFANTIHRIASGDFTATWDIAQMPAGPIPVAIGVEFRDERFSQDFDAQQNAGNVDGSAGGADVQGSRAVLAIYAEASIPITEDLEVSLAARFDDYNDFGTTVNPKVSVGYRPTDTLLLRASYGEGFRAPSMGELHSSAAQSFNEAIDATRCAATPEGDPTTGRSTIPESSLPAGHPCLTTQFQNFTGGNLNLNAELSESFNVGVVFSPIDDLSISLDYYSIDLKDQISTLPLQALLDAELATMGSPQVARGGNGRVNFILANNQNLVGTKTNGLDLDLRYSFSAGSVGDFTSQLNWRHVNNFVRDTGDGLGFDQVTFTPDDRIQWNLNWSMSDYSATLIGNYINSTPIGGGATLDDWTTWDLQVNWATPWSGRLTVGARNLFDKDPPLSPQLGNPFYSNQLHDIFGRVPYIRYTQEL